MMDNWKKNKILARDQNQCRICGTDKQLRLFTLTDVPATIPAGAMPSVLHATLCKKHGRKLKKWHKGGKVKDPDREMDEYTRIYHQGIFQAKDHLDNM
jgi:hypothetical protein